MRVTISVSESTHLNGAFKASSHLCACSKAASRNLGPVENPAQQRMTATSAHHHGLTIQWKLGGRGPTKTRSRANHNKRYKSCCMRARPLNSVPGVFSQSLIVVFYAWMPMIAPDPYMYSEIMFAAPYVKRWNTQGFLQAFAG